MHLVHKLLIISILNITKFSVDAYASTRDNDGLFYDFWFCALLVFLFVPSTRDEFAFEVKKIIT